MFSEENTKGEERKGIEEGEESKEEEEECSKEGRREGRKNRSVGRVTLSPNPCIKMLHTTALGKLQVHIHIS